MIVKRKYDPNLMEETKEEYSNYIQGGLQKRNIPCVRTDFLNLEKKFNITLKEDLYKYIKFLEKFYNKNIPTWYNSFKVCEGNSFKVPFLEFDELFPIPNSSDNYNGEDLITVISDLEIVVEFDIPNRVYQFRHNPPPEGQTYANLRDILKDIVLWSMQDMKKSEFYKEYPQIYRTHKGIVDEFLRGLRTL